MADSKISALPASTTPLAGTEVLPIVQSSTTKQVSVANLTAGRAISATQLTLTTGNLIVASGQGVDFSATSSGSGTMTSELLADYEEGTWTPASGVGTATGASGVYTKIGRQVTVIGTLTFPTQVNAGQASITGLPFTSGATGSGGTLRYTDFGSAFFLYGDASAATIGFYSTAGVSQTYTAFSGKRVDFAMTYFV